MSLTEGMLASYLYGTEVWRVYPKMWEKKSKEGKRKRRTKKKKTEALSHALTEACQRAGFLLVAALSEPALDGAHVPVQLLGEPLKPLLIWMLEDGGMDRKREREEEMDEIIRN